MGSKSLQVSNTFECVSQGGPARVASAFPQGDHSRIPPGRALGLYCTMDEPEWRLTVTVRFHDALCRTHSLDLDVPTTKEDRPWKS